MKQKILLTTLGIFLAAVHNVFSQAAISGAVIEKSSGDPLPGVNIVIGGTTQGAATGAEGRYRISNIEAGT